MEWVTDILCRTPDPLVTENKVGKKSRVISLKLYPLPVIPGKHKRIDSESCRRIHLSAKFDNN